MSPTLDSTPASHPLLGRQLEYLAGGARHEGVVDRGGAARRREHGLVRERVGVRVRDRVRCG